MNPFVNNQNCSSPNTPPKSDNPLANKAADELLEEIQHAAFQVTYLIGSADILIDEIPINKNVEGHEDSTRRLVALFKAAKQEAIAIHNMGGELAGRECRAELARRNGIAEIGRK